MGDFKSTLSFFHLIWYFNYFFFIGEDEFETESIGRCRALYDYDATQRDELTIHEGKSVVIVRITVDPSYLEFPWITFKWNKMVSW